MLINKEITKKRQWVIKSQDTPEAEKAICEIAHDLGINPIVARLLYNRGYYDSASADSFIRMKKEMLRNPFTMADMDKAVARIKRAIDNKEKITVYGDYDVDGVTSVCTLYLYLKSEGADVDYYIPNRTGEGYGVSSSAIDVIKENGTKLIITVDTGITANAEVEYARSVGIDFVITDHHECRAELPLADAVINPHRPDCEYKFKELAGVGVVFKLVCAYHSKYHNLDLIKATFDLINRYGDLVAIGTIADVMPIKEENRIIVTYGLKMIENTSRLGLAALIDASSGRTDSRRNERNRKHRKTKITSGYIGFTLAPRINAAGRVRSATLAVELFLSEDEARAREIAEMLCEANKERQAEENKIMLEAYDMISTLDIDNNPVIVLNANDWHHGVIGIVSSRITEKFGRPSILVSFEGNSGSPSPEDVGKGSGRSIKGLNLVDALCHCQDNLVQFGGHELAAGLSVTREQLPLFVKNINDYARETLSLEDLISVIETDCEIQFEDINLALAESLQLLEPYGVSNPIPMFIMRNVCVNELTGISEGKHTKLVLGNNKMTLSAMYFSNSPDSLGIYVGDRVDVLFSIDINEWQDRRSVQLIVRDIKPSVAQSDLEEQERARFDEIKNGATFTAMEDVIPERNDFVAVYKYIQTAANSGIYTFSHKDLCNKVMAANNGYRLGYIKLKFIIMIFRELNIVGIEEENEVYTFRLHYSSSKRNLDKSYILKRLRTQLR